jgi:hypothetical protein
MLPRCKSLLEWFSVFHCWTFWLTEYTYPEYCLLRIRHPSNN